MTTKLKSPFIIKQEFMSPMVCEQIVDKLGFAYPDFDPTTNVVIPSMKYNDEAEAIIYERTKLMMPELNSYYDIELTKTEQIEFEWHSHGCGESKPRAENAEYVRQKWLKVRNRQLSAVLFLSTYNDDLDSNFDPSSESYGGGLQFPQHKFTINPQIGTLVVFPSYPQFINNITAVSAGNLIQARFHFTSDDNWCYNAHSFPGTFEEWFREIV